MSPLVAAIALPALCAPLVFLIRKQVLWSALISLAALLAAATIFWLVPDDAHDEILGLAVRVTPLGRLAGSSLAVLLALLLTVVWLDQPAYNFFPAALGVGAAVMAVMMLVDPLATYLVLLIALMLPVGSFVYRVHENRSVEASKRHFAFVTLGGTIGVAALALSAALPRDRDQTTLVLLVVLLYLAFALKLAAIPFHTHAALLASHAPGAGLALYFGVLTPATVIAFAEIVARSGLLPSIVQLARVQDLLLGIGAVSALGGALLATGATDPRRLAVTCVISDIGVALIGIGSFSGPGIVGGITVALATGASASQQLLAAAALERHSAGSDLSAQHAPLAAAAFVAGGVGLVGAPPLVAFAGRFYVEVIAYSFSGWLGAALVVATLLLVVAQLRMAVRLFADGIPAWRLDRAPAAGLAGATISAALLLGGIAPDRLLRPIAAFAEEFLRAIRPL